MLEMLKARKEQLEAQGKKGFTLMEMLIVIAIIAVLIAIAIPVFTSQLDSANKATDEANVRSGYAQVQSKILLDSASADAKYYLKSDGTVAATTAAITDAATDAYKAKSTGSFKVGGVEATTAKDGAVYYNVKEGAIKSINSTFPTE